MADQKILMAVMAAYFLYTSGSIMPLIYMMLSVVGFLLIHLVINQEKILYVPDPMGNMKRPEENPQGFRSPKELGMQFENIYYETPDSVKIHAWWMKNSAHGSKPGSKGCPAILFCHANAGKMGMRLPNFLDLQRRLGFSIFAFDYRGFGNSEGTPEESGLILDGLAALAYMKKTCNCEETYIFGRSLGGAVAVAVAKAVEEMNAETAAKYPKIKGLILENTFTSISEIADKLFPFLRFLRPLKDRLIRLKWDTIDRIGCVSAKVLIMVGQKDEIVPPEHSDKLKCECQDARIVKFPEGMHNDTYAKGGEAYWAAMREFISET